MKRVILLSAFFILTTLKTYCLTYSIITTPCSAHGCRDGTITITLNATNCSNIMFTFPNGSGFSIPSGTTLNSSFLGTFWAGTYIFTLQETCSIITGYNQDGTPIYSSYNDLQSVPVTVTEPPCNLTLTIDSFSHSKYPGCQSGKISVTGTTTTCAALTPWYKAYLYRNGIPWSGPQVAPSGTPVHFQNLDSGSYYIDAYVIDPPFLPCCNLGSVCPTSSGTINLMVMPCPLNISIDSIHNSSTPDNCPNGFVSFHVGNSIDCNGNPVTYSYQLLLNGNAYLGNAYTGSSTSNAQVVKSILGAGSYKIVAHADTYPTCYDTSAEFTITEPPCGTINLDSLKKPCNVTSNNGVLYFSVTPLVCGGTSRSFFLLKNGITIQSGVMATNATQLVFSNLDTGSYKLRTEQYILPVAQYTFQNPFCILNSSDIILSSSQLSGFLSNNITTCQNSLPPILTFTGLNGHPPYLFTYRINGGAIETISTTSGSNIVDLPVSTSSSGTFIYKLISVSDADCNMNINDSSTINILPLPNANISTSPLSACQYANSPLVTFIASYGTPTYSFTYNINNGIDKHEFSNSGSNVSIQVPTDVPDIFKYKLTKISDAYCFRNLNDSVEIVIKPTTIPTTYPALRCVGDENISVNLVATVPPNSIGTGVFSVSNPYTGPNTPYSYSFTNQYGCPYTSNSYVGYYTGCIVITYSPRQICIKTFLEGLYIGQQIMNSALLNQGITSNTTISDSIEINIRNVTSPYSLVANTKTIINTNGTACWQINSPSPITGYYYIVIKHRNGIETWSSVPVYISGTPVYYDFTISQTAAFGNNQKMVEPNVWAIYCGDINQDENVDLLDLTQIEADINNFQFGYFSTDINGDGNVDLLDSPIVEQNINGFIFSNHP